MSESDQFINLRKAMANYRAYLQKQLEDCESGNFALMSNESGQRIDVTARQIADLKRLIAEQDKLLEGYS